ncbi:hypothetical protein BC829DRAFT_491790 [Chytridium lagenaria]|nr:hypothetical protein BC829DRAFT_491790 [Chytridium lagenaria]
MSKKVRDERLTLELKSIQDKFEAAFEKDAKNHDAFAQQVKERSISNQKNKVDILRQAQELNDGIHDHLHIMDKGIHRTLKTMNVTKAKSISKEHIVSAVAYMHKVALYIAVSAAGIFLYAMIQNMKNTTAASHLTPRTSLLYALSSGELAYCTIPFDHVPPNEVAGRICSCERDGLPSEKYNGAPPELAEVIRKCWSQDPHTRPNAQELDDATFDIYRCDEAVFRRANQPLTTIIEWRVL